MTDMSEVKSPRMRQLVQELRVGKSDALSSFWQDVKAAGVPFFEPHTITGPTADGGEEIIVDDKHLLVTFLFEGDEDTEQVGLLAFFMYPRMFATSTSVYAPDMTGTLIHRLENTNVWYWTEVLPADFRTQYTLFVNPQFTAEEGEAPPSPFDSMIPDPLNPLEMVSGINPHDDEMDKATRLSVLEGPHAAPQPHIEAGDDVPQGQVNSYHYQSAIFEDETYNWVYTPPGYDASRETPYHLLVMFDGFTYVDFVKTPQILDILLAAGKVPPTVCVIVSNFKNKRHLILPPNEKMPQALAEEVLVYMRENYHVSSDPADVTIGGCSYGGLAAAYNAFVRPDLFGNVLSQSGSYHWHNADETPGVIPAHDPEPGWLVRQYVNSPRLDINFYMDVGTHEDQSLPMLHGTSQTAMNRHMRDVLLAKGYQLHYVEYSGAHDYSWWRQTLADGLIVLHEMRSAGE